MTKTRWSHLVMALLAAAAVGCSDGASRLSPIGPSPVAELPAASPAATAAGWATANGWSAMADGRVAVADGVPDGVPVEATEVVSSVAGACPSRTITVRGVAVTVTASTAFSAPLTCDGLAGGQLVKIAGLLSYAPGGFSVRATHLSVVGDVGGSRAPAAPRGGEKLSGQGVVGPVSGACPSLTFIVMGHRVQATANTAYAGGTCVGVREGLQVRLDVDKQPDGTIYADRIEFLAAPGRP